jgi:hypothetical protein
MTVLHDAQSQPESLGRSKLSGRPTCRLPPLRHLPTSSTFYIYYPTEPAFVEIPPFLAPWSAHGSLTSSPRIFGHRLSDQPQSPWRVAHALLSIPAPCWHQLRGFVRYQTYAASRRGAKIGRKRMRWTSSASAYCSPSISSQMPSFCLSTASSGWTIPRNNTPMLWSNGSQLGCCSCTALGSRSR